MTRIHQFRTQTKNIRTPQNILQTTIGFQALMEILVLILKEVKEPERDKSEAFRKILVKAKDLDIADNNNPKKYPFANKTKNIFYNDLGTKIWGDKFELKEIKE